MNSTMKFTNIITGTNKIITMKKIFNITVWFRYVVNGEQEKDFEVHEIEAFKEEEAIEKVKSMYQSLRVIPFSFSS